MANHLLERIREGLEAVPDLPIPERSPKTPDANPHPSLGTLSQIPPKLTNTRQLSIIHKNEAKNFALEVVRSDEYRASIWRRIKTDTLAPAVEVRLLEYAYGKPVERVEVTNLGENLSQLSTAELVARAELVTALLHARKMLEEDGAA